MRRAYADVTVVSITAPPEILSGRLAARARSSDGGLADRLRRAVDDAAAAQDVTIVNVGSVEHHARELVRKNYQRECGPASRGIAARRGAAVQSSGITGRRDRSKSCAGPGAVSTRGMPVRKG